MHVRVDGSGPVVLFLHGIPTAGRLWDDIVLSLRDRFTCVVVDLPGTGQSPPLPQGSGPSRYADELEVLRRESGTTRWHIVGHDAGCVIAVHYASSFPNAVGRLALCSPPLFPEHRIAWFFRAIRVPFAGALIAPVLTPVIFFGLWWGLGRHDAATARIVGSFWRPFRGLRGAARFRAVLRWGEPAHILATTAGLLGRIQAPSLVIHGEQERVIPRSFALRTAAAIPRSEFRALECGHFSPLECPSALADALSGFLGADPEPKGTDRGTYPPRGAVDSGGSRPTGSAQAEGANGDHTNAMRLIG